MYTHQARYGPGGIAGSRPLLRRVRHLRRGRRIIPAGMSVWTKILGAIVLMGTMGLASCQGLLATIQAAH